MHGLYGGSYSVTVLQLKKNLTQLEFDVKPGVVDLKLGTLTSQATPLASPLLSVSWCRVGMTRPLLSVSWCCVGVTRVLFRCACCNPPPP